ncbi:MAG TPA: PQQ-binding-like beta-propeller repeat protein [Pyrinomonadaceae bacterium]
MLNQGTHIRSIFLLIVLTLFPSLHVFAQKPSADNHQPALSQPLTVKWLYESEFTINLTPATDGERIYLPLASGLLVSLRAADGQLLWKADLGGELSSSPIADEQSVYVASETVGEGPANHSSGALRALGQEGGITLWMRTLPMPFRGSLVANDVNLFGGSVDGRVYAVRKKTGDISWIMQHSAPFAALPTVFGPNLYVGSTDGTLFSLSQSTGKVNWRYRTRGAINGRAVVVRGVVYFGSADGFVYAVNEADGRLRWRRRTGAGVQTVAHAQSGLLVASLDNFVYLLSLGNGDRLWKRQLAGRLAAEPLTTSDGALFTPLSSSTGVVLDLRDGKQLNSLPIGEDNSLAASPIAAGKVLFVTTRHGLLAFSRPS